MKNPDTGATMGLSLRFPAWVTGILIAGLLIFVLAALPVVVNESRERTGHHIFDYTVRISSDTPLENLTLILPLPSVHDSSSLGKDLINGSGYGIPPGWNMTPGWWNGTPMLKVTDVQFMPERAPRPVPTNEDEGETGPRGQETITIQPIGLATAGISPGTRNGSAYSIRIEQGTNGTAVVRELPVLRPVEFGIRDTITTTINTRDPFGTEPLLYPKENLHETICDNPVTETARCFTCTSPVYIDYRSAEPADIEISVSLYAGNEWWEPGWSGNSYTDRIIATLQDDEKGWVKAEGTIVTGNGRY